MNLFKLLDKNLDYVSHEIIDNTIYIYVISNRNNCIFPYCRQYSSKIYSKYIHKSENLPISNKKLESIFVIIQNIPQNFQLCFRKNHKYNIKQISRKGNLFFTKCK